MFFLRSNSSPGQGPPEETSRVAWERTSARDSWRERGGGAKTAWNGSGNECATRATRPCTPLNQSNAGWRFPLISSQKSEQIKIQPINYSKKRFALPRTPSSGISYPTSFSKWSNANEPKRQLANRWRKIRTWRTQKRKKRPKRTMTSKNDFSENYLIACFTTVLPSLIHQRVLHTSWFIFIF